MKSTSNPTAEELRAWAFDASEAEPAQDWDLILSWLPYDDVYLELASSRDCPKADYFLSLLYFIVGDAVRTEFGSRKKEAIQDLLSKAQTRFPAHVIHLWVQRSRDLLAHPERFCYEDWCADASRWMAPMKKEPNQSAQTTPGLRPSVSDLNR